MSIYGEYESNSELETEKLGVELAKYIQGGDILAFVGQLGSGKTTLIKAIASKLGANKREMASPSFAIVHDYGGSPPIYHIDLYRVEQGEIEQLGLWEIFDDGNICFVEWADKFPEIIPSGALEVEIVRIGDKQRIITITDWNNDEV